MTNNNLENSLHELKETKEGILPVNKPKDKTSFSLVAALRRRIHVKKIGHAGTLDPFASGVMILLIGRNFTKRSLEFMNQEKEYLATVHLGISTQTYDIEGSPTFTSSKIPTLNEIEKQLLSFQGKILQIPPMFSAKKIQGKRLYELARKGLEVERAPIEVHMQTTLIDYQYPTLKLKVVCSKGTYIRSIANDLGEKLETGAHLKELIRTRSGKFYLENCLNGELLF